MDKNNGQNRKVTERVYNSTDINRIALGYKDDKVKVERQVSRTGQTPRPTPARAPQPNVNTRRATSDPRKVQQRRPGQTSNRRRKKKINGNGFFRFLIALVVLMLACVLIFAFVSNKEQSSNNGDVAATETKETTAQSSKTEETTGGAETTDETTGETKVEDPNYTYEFKADLSEYEEYMNPQGEQRDAYLLLVNTKNPLASDYVPDDMIDVKSTRKDGRNTQKLRLYAAKALEALMLEGEACKIIDTKTPSGYPLSVMSAYRSYSYQAQLFNTYVSQEMNSNKSLTRAEAEKIVETYSCRAGTSEHQSGLCVDMHTLWSAGQAFAKEDEAKWLAENCYKFGFILRFPEDKMDKTGGIIYEPWHFRYVGRYHATQMHELNMCLEEYIEHLNKK